MGDPVFDGDLHAGRKAGGVHEAVRPGGAVDLVRLPLQGFECLAIVPGDGKALCDRGKCTQHGPHPRQVLLPEPRGQVARVQGVPHKPKMGNGAAEMP
jgi:hypothetical protein